MKGYGQLWTGAWKAVAQKERVGVTGQRGGEVFPAAQAWRGEQGIWGEGGGRAPRYLHGPGAWGRSTAASSVTYTSIPRRISSPPPVAKTTCRLRRPRQGGGGGG